MIVTEANEFTGRIHDRMPVFLVGDSFEAWRDGSANVELSCFRKFASCLASIKARDPMRHRRPRSHTY
jgi:putative SOS response-associated peptidase YedK